MNKRIYLIGGVVAVLVIAGSVFAFTRFFGQQAGSTPEETTNKRRIEALNEIPIEDRPYVTIKPEGSRNLTLTLETLNKPADSAEYELEYQAGSLLQGAFGQLELSPLPSQTDVLLGSCSAGGACTYHEDVRGGSLLLRFDGAERYALKQDWKYIQEKGTTEVSSKDAKFQLEATSLAAANAIIVYNTPGFPEGLVGTPVSDPYSLQASSALTGSGDLTMRANEEGELTIMGWDGASWQEFATTTDGKTATAEVELMELYIVVKAN
jgi:hypothetical protein